MNYKTLGIEDLARSGLTLDDAKKLGMEVWSAEKTELMLPGHKQASIYIPYFHINGKKRKDMFRVRFLEPLPAGAFGARASEIIPKYGQPKGSPPSVYFPQNLPTDSPWESVCEDINVRLWITEGEKKASAATKYGFVCIGLGGVWSFGSSGKGLELLPDLKQINWSGREVIICFDADIMVKPEVAKAVSVLFEVLLRHGANVKSLVLPDLGMKTGLDDFIVMRGPASLQALADEEELLPNGDLALELIKLNTRYAVIHHPPSIYDELAVDGHGRNVPMPMTFAAFSSIEAPRRALKPVNERRVFVPVSQEWVTWPGRQEFESLTYRPGFDRVINKQINSWRGLGVQSKKGDVQPWHDLLRHLFKGCDPEATRWFERWCGYPLKYLGTKLLSAVAIWSPNTGQGKTLIGETLGKIYGANYISIPQHVLEDDFTGWALGKQFVLVDDISSHDTRSRADLLKKLITQTELNVNVKHVAQFTMPDYINYYFTSNHADAFYLDRHDRRLFIHEVTVPKLEESFYNRYYEWLNSDGPAALLHYFQERLDYGEFSPVAAPPVTTAKLEMIDGVQSEVDAWIIGLASLDLGGRELWTAAELCDKFNATAVGRKVAPNAFGRKLGRYYPCIGLVEDGTSLRKRYFALQNTEAWSKRSKKEAAQHVKSNKAF